MGIGRRTFLASGLAAVATPAMARTAAGPLPQVTLKLHHAASSMSCVHVNFVAPWARQVEAQSGGRIRIDIFPSMMLGGQPADLFDQVCERTTDLALVMPSMTPGRFPKIETFELPFVPSCRALVSSKALQDFAAEHLADEFRAVHPICFCCADRGVVHARRPVRTLADLKDMRLSPPTRFAAVALQALGARPVPVADGQLAYAVSRGVLDGCLIAWGRMPPLKLDTLLKTHTDFAEWSLSTTTFALLMNKRAYEKLPADLKKVLDDNSGQFAAGMAGTMWDLQATLVAGIADRRGDVAVTLAPGSAAPWRKAIEPVIASFVGELKPRRLDGAKLIASARSLLARYAGEPAPQAPPRSPPASQSPVPEPATAPPPAATANAAPGPNPPPKVAASPKFTTRPRATSGSASAAAAPAPAIPPSPPASAAPAAKTVPAVTGPPRTLDIPL